MNEEYLKQIYGYLGGEKYADFETFSKDLSTNPEYNKQIFDYLYSGQEGIDYDAFSFDTGLKKKEPSASSAEQSPTQPTQQAQPFELPSSVGQDTTERQGKIDVPDFGQIEEPSKSATAIADDLGVATQDLKITGVLQDPKAQERNLGRPLPTSEQYKVNGKPVYRDEMIDVINNQVNKIQAGTVDIEISDDPELQTRLQRQVQSGSRGGDILESLGAGLVSTAQSLEGLPSLVAATIEEITGLPATETSMAIQSRLNAMDLGRRAEEIREKTRAYEGNFLESLLSGNFVDAAAQGMNLTMESLPITAISAVTGGGGSIGSYLLRSATTLTPIMASREFSESQVSQDPDIQRLEQSRKVLRSWLYGGAEALGESVTGRIASKNFDILKGSLKATVGRAAAEVGEAGATQTARQIAKNTAIDIAKNMGVDMNQEGISEAVTEMTQMLTDDLMGVKSYAFGEYAERMSNAYASGAFMGAVMGLGGAAGVSADAVKKYRSTTYQNIAKGLERSVAMGGITEAEANVVKEDAAAISQTNPTLSDAAQAAQASLIKERNGLEQFLEGVDKAAAPREYERINQINQELTKIAENDETRKEDQELFKAEAKVGQENQVREEVETRDVVDEKETVLEDPQDGGVQEEGEQESPELRTEEEVADAVQEQEKTDIAESIGGLRRVKPKNIRGLLDVMGGMFGLNKPQAESAAVVGDVMVETMAKRAGISKDEMYQRIAFQKAQMKDLPQGVRLQANAWHGSPYQFDKFTTEKIGTGEGRQAFGWGLYFADLESIARDYADNLSEPIIYIDGKKFLYEGENRYNPIWQLGAELFRVHSKKDLLEEASVQEFRGDITQNQYQEIKAFAGTFKTLEKKKERNLYKVSLHKGKTPDQYTWLEWDKPLSATNKKIILDNLPDNPAKRGKVDNLRQNIDKNSSDIYKMLSDIFNSDKKASLFLLENGIEGIKYPAESVSRGATSDTARGFNYVVFDENAVSIEEVIKFQKDAEKARGAMMMAMDNQAIIYALTNPNVSTPLHELAHVYEHYLTDAERNVIQDWAGTEAWTTETSEKFARGFEKYLSEGKAPLRTLQKYFDNFKNWLLEIYNGIVGSDIDIELNTPMRKVYDSMLGAKKTTSVASETKGLTERERFVQGFKEIMSAKDEKVRQAKESVKEKLAQARAKFGERMSAEKKKVSEAKATRAELSRLINLEMKELGLGGVRTQRVRTMIAGIKNVTPNNIDKVVDRVYNALVAEAKAQRLNTYKKKSKQAKARIEKGQFDTTAYGMLPLMELDARAVLEEDIQRYTELVDEFSRRGKFAVEDIPQKIQEATEIVDRAYEQMGLLEAQASNIEGLTEENYNEEISRLLESEEITRELADFMRNNKRRLLSLEKAPINKEELFFEIQDKVEFVKNNQQDLMGDEVKQGVQDVIVSIKRGDLEAMSDAELSLLNRVLDAMEVGLMPSQAAKLATNITSNRDANRTNEHIRQNKTVIGRLLSLVDTPIRELLSNKIERVRRQALKTQSTTMDSTFGLADGVISDVLAGFQTKWGEFNFQVRKYQGMLSKAIKDTNKSQSSDIKTFMYMAEMHRSANPASTTAYSVKEFVEAMNTEATMRTYVAEYGMKRYKEIVKLYDEFKDEGGEIDSDKLFKAMTKAERDYIATAEKIFAEMTVRARTAKWVRGEKFVELNYYMNYPVVLSTTKSDVNTDVDRMMQSGSARPSTRAGLLEERSKGGAPVVSFSLAESVQNSYNETLQDYYLTQSLRTERATFNKLVKLNENDPMFVFTQGLNKGVEDQRKYLLVGKAISNFNNPITNAIKAGAYRYLLGSTTRAVKEVLSNLGFVAMSDIANLEFAAGKSFEVAKKTIQNPMWLFSAMENLPSSQKERILGSAVFAGQADAATTFGEDIGFTAKSQSLDVRAARALEKIQDLGVTIEIGGNRVRISQKAYAQALTSNPDMFFSRGVFFERLQNLYKKETGESLDLNKLSDKRFMNDNRALFSKLTKAADAAVRKGFSTTNMAERSGVQLKAAAEGGLINQIKYFMLPFVINEYEQTRMAAVNDGLFAGLKTAIPVLTRFAIYGMMTGALTRAFVAAISEEDEPIEELLPKPQEFKNSLISAIVTLVIQRNMTFVPRAGASYIIEYLNKEFGGGVTRPENKEYNSFTDNVAYNRINLDDIYDMKASEMVGILAPQYTPIVQGFEDINRSNKPYNVMRKDYYQMKAAATFLAGLGLIPRDVKDYITFSDKITQSRVMGKQMTGELGSPK